jgi:hypothetical protein
VTADTFLLAVSTVAAFGAAWFGGRAVADGRRFFRETARERELDHLLTITRTLTEVSQVTSRIVHLVQGQEPLFAALLDRLSTELALIPGRDLTRSRAVAAAPRDRSGVNIIQGALVGQAIEEAGAAVRELSARTSS